MRKNIFYSINSLSQIFIAIAIVVVLNLVLANVSLRWDLTEGNQYTLSPVSQKLMKDLQDPVTFKVFFSEEVPQNMLALKQDVNDLLNEYRRAAGRNLLLEISDPKSTETGLDDARTYGIPEIQYNIVGNEKFEVSTGYAGMAIIFGDKYETIPVFAETQNLEYDISSAVNKLTKESTAKIGFLSDHGVVETQNLQRALGQQYEVLPVTLDNISADLQTLVIAGPSEEFSDADRYNIDQFVMRGGALVVLLNGVKVDEKFLMVTPNETKLDELLKSYGITVNKDLVADFVSAETLTFGGGAFSVIQQYPYWPILTTDGLNQQNPISASVRSAVLPWTSSLSFVGAEGIEVVELAQSSAQSAAFDSATTSSAAPNAIDVPSQGVLGKQLLAGLLRGKLTSAYKDSTPEGIDGANKISETENSRLVVIGSAKFIEDALLERSVENAALVMNAVDVLSQDESFISIRSRSAFQRPLKPLSDGKKIAIKYANIFSSVVIVVILALIMYLVRRRQDKKAQIFYT